MSTTSDALSWPHAREGRWGKAAFLHGLALAATIAAATHPLRAEAAITFQVSFNDPGSTYASFYDGIRSNVVSAGAEWANLLGSNYSASLQVQLSFADIATASGASVTNSYVGLRGGLSTYEQGAAYEVRTGRDPNGALPDIQITLGRSGYLQNELWFDPSPTRQSVAVPTSRTDARSVFLHELGHAFAFNGWRDGVTGALPGGYQSTFDSWVTVGNVLGSPQLFFTGNSARSLYGGPVPLTFGNYGHIGNVAPRPGAKLVPVDLMNGVAFSRGTRYHVSPLDLAMLSDTGFAVPLSGGSFASTTQTTVSANAPFASSVPEPPAYALLLVSLITLGMARRVVHGAISR